jgi:hypothetical protein
VLSSWGAKYTQNTHITAGQSEHKKQERTVAVAARACPFISVHLLHLLYGGSSGFFIYSRYLHYRLSSGLKTDKKFSASFSSFFLFCHVIKCFSAGGAQKHTEKKCPPKVYRKVFQKIDKNPMPMPILSRFSIRIYHAFLGERSSKTP